MSSIREEIDERIDDNKSYKDKTDQAVKVAFYTRVSSEKEAQLHSLSFQTEWCYKVLEEHPLWEMTQIYTDKGITGTQAKKRSGFLKAVDDGKQGMYQLMVVRDVSRFARNAEESLRYTHILKEYGVEVFFQSDNIWSMDKEGDLRLGLMSILSQDESRRISDKVKAGQRIAMNKGVLFGTGNILGYRLVKRKNGNTYEIVEEEAETVRLIYDLYVNHGMGVKRISNIMVEKHRKNASGEIRWDPGKITRILSNKTLCGYLAYNKTKCLDYLTHKQKRMGKDEHIYIKADFPAIIKEEVWEKAQEIMKSHSSFIRGKITGKKPKKDKWNLVMTCQCGASFKKYKWRTNIRTGEECIGYECLNQAGHRKRSFIEANGLQGDGYCEVRCIAQWHLEMQMKKIIERIWKNPQASVDTIISNIEKNYVRDEPRDNNTRDYERLIKEKKRQEQRLKNLIDMRIDNQIDKETFITKKAEISVRIADIDSEITELNGMSDDYEETDADLETAITKIKEALKDMCDTSKKEVSRELVLQFVDRIIACEGSVFKWYLKIGMDSSGDFKEDSFVYYGGFDISFEEAKAYRKQYGNFIRKVSWRDIHTEIYVRYE